MMLANVTRVSMESDKRFAHASASGTFPNSIKEQNFSYKMNSLRSDWAIKYSTTLQLSLNYF